MTDATTRLYVPALGGIYTAVQEFAQPILRIALGGILIPHGLQKLFGVLGGHRAHFFSEMWLAGVLESAGGLLIFLGFFTRPVAFLLCGEMAVAFFKAHAPRGFLPIANGGELAVLYCFIFLYLMSSGAGPLSLDRSIRKK